jgi:hypothetical protein
MGASALVWDDADECRRSVEQMMRRTVAEHGPNAVWFIEPKVYGPEPAPEAQLGMTKFRWYGVLSR